MSKQRLLILLTGLCLLGYGIFNKEPSRVMSKAIRTCLECIGIG